MRMSTGRNHEMADEPFQSLAESQERVEALGGHL
jgi:hypothetical protein